MAIKELMNCGLTDYLRGFHSLRLVAVELQMQYFILNNNDLHLRCHSSAETMAPSRVSISRFLVAVRGEIATGHDI